MFGIDDKKKRYRCFQVNEANIQNVHESVRDNVKPGDQYCQIETPEGEVLAASGGEINPTTGLYEESAVFGTEKDIEMARKLTIRKLKNTRR